MDHDLTDKDMKTPLDFLKWLLAHESLDERLALVKQCVSALKTSSLAIDRHQISNLVIKADMLELLEVFDEFEFPAYAVTTAIQSDALISLEYLLAKGVIKQGLTSEHASLARIWQAKKVSKYLESKGIKEAPWDSRYKRKREQEREREREQERDTLLADEDIPDIFSLRALATCCDDESIKSYTKSALEA